MPGHLARLQSMGQNEFAMRYFSEWLQGLSNVHNVKVLDLFEWEQGHGNWLAMTQLEFDSAWRDIFTPYNCRNVLTTMLSVDEKYRKAPNYELFLALIRKLWPETLCEPINPQNKGIMAKRFKRKVKSLFSRYLY